MYSSQQTKQLQLLTDQLIGEEHTEKAFEIVEDLRSAIQFHEYRYYVLNDPLITDDQYDRLFKLLQSIEAAHPELITTTSPTQRVGSSLNPAFKTVQHLVPMLSLDNSYNADDLVDWDRKVREQTGLAGVEYCIEPKFDGASISLIYENNRLVRGATRGNGIEGDDVTTNIRQVRSIPLSASFTNYGVEQVEIRGEIMMSRNAFKKFNEGLAAQNLPPLANPRNAASGSLRMKDPKDVGRRNLEAFLYNISYHTQTSGAPHELLQTHSGSLQMLWNLGFRSPVKEMKVVQGIQAVIDYVTAFEQQRDDLPYEVDGMVVKVNSIALQDRMGMTTHHPRWAIAYKFKARQATSILRKVDFQVGRTGSITPVAKIDPVQIGGATITSISLFNEEIIRDKDLMTGDTVLVERAGDVIPYIVKSLPELRSGNEQRVHFPTGCPACNSPLYKEEGEAVWRCINIECPAQVVEKMIHFVSKDAMDIRSFGEANVRKFWELGLLKDIPGIYKLNFAEISKLDGFGKKSIDNLQSAIEASKAQPLHRLIFALGIRYVGETTAKTLANAVSYLPDLARFSEEQLQQLEDIGTKVAGSVYGFFQNSQNTAMLHELELLGVQLTNHHTATSTDGGLSGQTFLFTGTLTQLKRSQAEELVEKNGGKTLSSVSSKLNYLVVGDDAGSKLEKAKKLHSVRIISEADFVNMLGGASSL